MPDTTRTIMDPFNNKIHLITGICSAVNENDPVYEEASMVIQKPAICVEIKNNNNPRLYYFRSIDWHNTMLIMVQFQNNRWETSHCEKNPSNKTLSDILKNGRQLL